MNDTGLDTELGMFQKTKNTRVYNGHVRPVYKKKIDVQRYLLQLPNGDWVKPFKEDKNNRAISHLFQM